MKKQLHRHKLTAIENVLLDRSTRFDLDIRGMESAHMTDMATFFVRHGSNAHAKLKLKEERALQPPPQKVPHAETPGPRQVVFMNDPIVDGTEMYMEERRASLKKKKVLYR